jgi:phenylpropionate dioxygenase-like ring-hydroxylating dioxygenase large terminal subunit
MLVTQQALFRHFWYPVMPVSRLADGKPQPMRLLGEDIVVWRTADGRHAAMEDRCCHRTARLSMGWVEDQRLVCAYHGWSYDCTGQCVAMPQNPEATQIPYKVRAFQVDVRYDYVWVCLEPQALNRIPDLEEHGVPGFRMIHQFYEPCRTSGLRLMENFFDFSHTGFVHKGTFGNMADARPRQTQIEATDYGFVLRGDVPVLNADEHIKRVVRDGSAETVRRMVSKWYFPFMRKSQINYPSGLIHSLVTCATPIDDGTSMLCQWIYRNDTEADVPAADCIALDRRITDEDILILEGLDPDVPLRAAPEEEVSMYTDRPGIAMRKRLLEMMTAHGETEVRSDRNRRRWPLRPAQAA